jgi:hypothetical protein
MDWIDERPLDQLTFGFEAPLDERESTAAFVRETLQRCGVKLAQDIGDVGCSGLAAQGISIEDSKRILLGLAGSGCGLVCYVPVDRFCLVHGGVGGLQVNQASRHIEHVPSISRDLTPSEKLKVELVESARRIRARSTGDRILDTADALSGRKVPDDLLGRAEAILGDVEPEPEPEPAPQQSAVEEPEEPWTCPEHGKTFWGCRFCVAAEIVNGPLVPFLGLGVDGVPAKPDTPFRGAIVKHTEPEVVKDTIADLDNSDRDTCEVWVRVAHWRRKLARD